MRNWKSGFCFIIHFICCITANATPIILQKPILFNEQRIALTQDYQRIHYGINKQSITIVPQMIVLHWTAYPFNESFNLMYPPTLTKERTDIQSSGLLNVSAHFLVGRDGTIYQLMPSHWMARHVIGLNNIAIGIENVGGINGRADLTEAQVAADVALIRYLVKQHPSIHYLIGHFEYGQFRNSPLWEEKDPHYFTEKNDPGPEFMKKVRLQVKDLSLLGPPKRN